MYDRVRVAIIGAGAAGLMAAIEGGRAARDAGLDDGSVVAFDGAPRIGAKILISGGGRCNVTHDVVHPRDYNGANENRVARVLRSFTVEDTIAFFDRLGVRLVREETGKLFPSTNRARDVIDAMLDGVSGAGATIRSGHRVTAVEPDGEGFRVVFASQPPVAADRVVLATGGLSVPKTGSDGAGYGFAKRFGHSVTPRFPALVPLRLDASSPLLELRGITIPAALELRSSSGKRLRRETGSLLFAHFGITGPLPLDMSRHWIAARRDDRVTLHLSVMPQHSAESIDEWLRAEASAHPREHIESTLARHLPARLATVIATVGAGAPDLPLGRLSRDGRRALGVALTAMPLPVTGDRGFEVAEVTAGGVPLEETDTATMQSRKRSGLFLCGEILDVDGRIGGYNFQWAWASGRLAGRAAVSTLERAVNA